MAARKVAASAKPRKAEPRKPARGMSKTKARALAAPPVRSARGAADPSATPRTTSTFSPRLQATRKALEGLLQARFGKVEPMFAWNVHGWRVKRPRAVPWTTGTMDPNFVCLFVAERKQGLVVYLWNPIQPGGLQDHRAEFEEAGFKVMVGCLQFNRKGDFPLAAIAKSLDRIKASFDAEV